MRVVLVLLCLVSMATALSLRERFRPLYDDKDSKVREEKLTNDSRFEFFFRDPLCKVRNQTVVGFSACKTSLYGGTLQLSFFVWFDDQVQEEES